MFVDINAAGMFGSAATGAGDARKLFDSQGLGAARGERLFQAIAAGFKDHEPSYMYMITSPESMAELRAANLVEETKVTDGELEFDVIFDGKFRLLHTRTNFMPSGLTTGNLNAQSTKMTMLLKPGAVSFAPVGVPKPVATDNDESAYQGGGVTELWYRWGYVWHPEGYGWDGAENAFATNTTYAAAASWERKTSALNLPFLPIFHS